MPPSDFRSDTVTRPTPAMREAMAKAEVGDDVFGDDPTVKKLQDTAALIFGKEAALLMPSGTMANQSAVRCHVQPGDEVILHRHAHLVQYEVGGIAALSHAQAHPLDGPRGMMPIEAIKGAIRARNVHIPVTRLICLENTHNMASGAVLPFDYLQAVHDLAREAGIALHLDGARVFNASVAAGIPVSRYAALFDSVSCCLSKGLGAPVGSLLLGTAEFITRAHRVRKLLGGGMRQAGVLAAAGLLALTEGPRHLAADHRRARAIATHIAGHRSLSLHDEPIDSNIVIFTFRERPERVGALHQALAERGVLCSNLWGRALRFVTHRDVGDEDVARAVDALDGALREAAQ